MTQHTVTTYTYDELPTDSAKEKAREWWTAHVFEDSCDWDFVYEDFTRVAEILGIELYTRTVRLYGGGTREEPRIWFSGFWSQGDGACWEGRYRYNKGCARQIRDYAPQDTELHRIADALTTIQKHSGYGLTATVTHTGHYYHSRSVTIDAGHNLDWDFRLDLAADLEEALRDTMDWLYQHLEAEYDYQTSEEAVAESLRINEYDFTEEGKLWPR